MTTRCNSNNYNKKEDIIMTQIEKAKELINTFAAGSAALEALAE